MKKLILISMMFCASLSAKDWNFENPNGRPFLLTLHLQEGGSGFTLPISKFLTIRYSSGSGEGYALTNFEHFGGDYYEWATVDCYGDCDSSYSTYSGASSGDDVRIRDEDVIDLSKSSSFAIDIHIPLYQLFGN